MISLLSDIHFWTTNEMKINNSNYGVFNYSLNGKQFNSSPPNLSLLAKKEYWEKNHDGLMILSNHKPTRLKDNLRKLDDFLHSNKIIKLIWKDNCIVQILLSNGLLIYLCINLFTGDILKLAFDKYFIGKLATDTITDGLFSTQNIILAYNTNQITIVNLQKPNTRRYGPEKITNMDPKIFHVIIPGPTGDKKLSRNLAINNSFDFMVIWTKSSRNEIFPWRPTKRDQDQANVHVFRLRLGKIESIGYCWTQNDPFCVEFLSIYGDDQFITVEQKVSRKGEISVEIHSYKIIKGKLPRTTVHSIPLHTQVCSYSFSPDQEKIFLGTVDYFICIHDLKQQTTKFSSKTDIIPIYGTWHSDSTLILIANQRSQIQMFDIALNPVLNQLVSDDIGQNNLDLSKYFFNVELPKLLNIKFSLKPQLHLDGRLDKYAQTDSFVIFHYDNGQIGCIRFFAVTGITNDIHNSGLTSDVIVNRYLEANQLEKAVNMLLSTNWESNGAICLLSLHKITNFCLMKSKIKRNRIELLLKAFKSFSSNLNDEVKDEYGDQIIDLKRRLFFFLIRNEKFSEAFEIAHQIEDYDLFMDLFNCTKSDINLLSLTNQSYNQAEFYYNQNESATIPDDDIDSNDTSSSSSSDCITTSFTTVERDTKIRRKSTTALENKKNYKISNAVIKPPESLTLKPYSDDSSSIESALGTNTTPIKTHIAEVTCLKKSYVPPLPTLSSQLKVNQFKSTSFILNSEYTNLNKRFNNTEFRPIKTENNTLREYDLKNQMENIRSIPGRSQNLNTKNFEVTELVPSPNSRNLSKYSARSIWSRIPDQTIGIPHLSPIKQNRGPESLISSISSSSPHTSLPYQFNSNVGELELQDLALRQTQSPKLYQHPLVSGTIPPANYYHSISDTPYSSLTNCTRGERQNQEVIYSNIENMSMQKDLGIPAERNKVKFSDTVQVAVVQEVKKEKPLPLKRNLGTNNVPDPQKELAESLPLCHPNDKYLKDFEPLQEVNEINFNGSTLNDSQKDMTDYNKSSNSNNNSNTNNNGSIKVIHFGVV